mmetsp:Transcript_18347/g.30820  ORF Transcript_18347/g.30820 Transcript_18347/m.30820 type:complete len:244 (+) Transcript_18347:193-924(+)
MVQGTALQERGLADTAAQPPVAAVPSKATTVPKVDKTLQRRLLKREVQKGQWGYATQHCIMAWKRIHADVPATQILEADPDIAKPLYFWQLVSLIGTELMFDIVNKFYTRVYEDIEDPTFVAAFTRVAKKEHHIETQIQLWVDAMGAGKFYHGGASRLDFHHKNNASQVLNHCGAVRWMGHMRDTFEETNFGEDPRVKVAMMDFLFVMMEHYKHDFKFNTGAAVYGDEWIGQQMCDAKGANRV